MNRVYLHSNNDEKKNIIRYIYLIIPFMIFGFYKNGISLYLKHTISFINIFKPLLFTGISVLISFIFSKWNKKSFLNYTLIANILISIITFPNTNLIIYIIIISLVNLLFKYIKFNFNIISLYMILYSIILMILNKYTYLNIYECNYELKLLFIDYLFGKGIGGISNTLIIYIIICFCFLITNINYKKLIPIISLIEYYTLVLIISFINNSFDPNLVLNSNLLFGIIFISTINIYSPYTKGGCVIYGLVLGILLFISSFIDLNLGIYISIFILSIIYQYFDKLITHKK